MEGLNKQEAIERVVAGLSSGGAFAAFGKDRACGVIAAALDADLSYMEQAGVLSGGAYYDDDDAYEAICDSVSAQMGLSDEDEVLACRLIDEYMELIEAYFTEKGLIGWE